MTDIWDDLAKAVITTSHNYCFWQDYADEMKRQRLEIEGVMLLAVIEWMDPSGQWHSLSQGFIRFIYQPDFLGANEPVYVNAHEVRYGLRSDAKVAQLRLLDKEGDSVMARGLGAGRRWKFEPGSLTLWGAWFL